MFLIPVWPLSTGYDITSHYPLVNRWRPITDPGQVEKSALQIYWLGHFKNTFTHSECMISSFNLSCAFTFSSFKALIRISELHAASLQDANSQQEADKHTWGYKVTCPASNLPSQSSRLTKQLKETLSGNLFTYDKTAFNESMQTALILCWNGTRLNSFISDVAQHKPACIYTHNQKQTTQRGSINNSSMSYHQKTASSEICCFANEQKTTVNRSSSDTFLSLKLLSFSFQQHVCSIRCFYDLYTSGMQLYPLLYTTATWGK